MPKYRVKLVSEETKVAFVEVEAEHGEEAAGIAYEYEEKDLAWTTTYSQYYIDDTKELKGDGHI
jgi:hypothetical protein